jgi:hypothetical protein
VLFKISRRVEEQGEGVISDLRAGPDPTENPVSFQLTGKSRFESRPVEQSHRSPPQRGPMHVHH